MRVSTLCGALLAAAASAAADSLPTITSVGNKFFKGDDQFFIKGVAYQLSPDDPLVDGDQCARDVVLMKALGVNTIRVYHVDASADHSSCMSTFAEAGIYTLIDLDTFDTYILTPTMPGPSWNKTQYDSFAAVMDAFATFDNLLGFFVGNEVISLADQSLAAPYIKAAAHDMKAYRDSKKYPKFPIGYSAADIAELRPMLQDYLTCGGKEADIVDFFSLNSYEWCDPSTFTTSGYSTLEDQAKDFPVPIFFSETGCNVPGPRLFADQSAIFGPSMVADISGSIIYEWIQEANNYGLITYGAGDASDDGPRSGTPSPMTPDFANLKAQWATLKPTGVASSAYDAKSVSTRDCPASTADGWLVDGDVPLPTLGSDVSAGDSAGDAAPTTTGKTTAKATAKATGKNADKTTATGTAATATGTAAAGTAAGSDAGSTAAASGSSKSSAAAAAPRGLGLFNRELVAAGAGLVGVMMVFTLWL